MVVSPIVQRAAEDETIFSFVKTLQTLVVDRTVSADRFKIKIKKKKKYVRHCNRN